MSSWKGVCSQLGNHWAVEVKPGSDTSFKEVVPGIPPCFGLASKLEFIRKMDVLSAKDGNHFSTKMVVDRDEYVSSFKADASLLLLKEQLAGCKCKEDIIKLFSSKFFNDTLKAKTSIDLWTVQEILDSDMMKCLDSSIISLYTKNNDKADIIESFLILGVKDLSQAIECAATHYLEAKQKIDLPIFVNKAKSFISIRFTLPVKSQMILKAGFKIKGNKVCLTKCRAGASAIYGIGWALQGYGEGGYGL